MIYKIPKNHKSPPEPLEVSSLGEQGWNEKDLENYLFEYLPKLIGPDLMVIGQSSPYQPEVDLLALDSAGDLWFFELKAVRSSSEHLLQVLRYSQSYSGLSIDGLSDIYEKFTGDTARSLAVAFCDYFGYSSPSSIQEWGNRIGKNHHLVVVADGADDETISAVNHWQRHGLDITIWSYRIFASAVMTDFYLELPDFHHRGRRISHSVPGIFLVNTNRRFDSDSEEYMMAHGVALAKVERWMRKINRIVAGSRVLLYGNQSGILAAGVATPERRDGELDGIPMRYVKLRDFKRLASPIHAREIKEIGGKDFVFRHTVLEITGEHGERVWQAAMEAPPQSPFA